jgi:hypothetical protein
MHTWGGDVVNEFRSMADVHNELDQNVVQQIV